MEIEELLNADELHMAQLLRAELDELGLPPGIIRVLRAVGINTLGDLTSKTRAQLLGVRFLGRRNVAAIEEMLNRFDLKLRTK